MTLPPADRWPRLWSRAANRRRFFGNRRDKCDHQLPLPAHLFEYDFGVRV